MLHLLVKRVLESGVRILAHPGRRDMNEMHDNNSSARCERAEDGLYVPIYSLCSRRLLSSGPEVCVCVSAARSF